MDPTCSSSYELRRWRELEAYWEKVANPSKALPPKARAVVEVAGSAAKRVAAQTGTAISNVTPQPVKNLGSKVVDASLAPTLNAAAHLLELTTDWVAELTNPQSLIDYHRKKGRSISTLDDLKRLDLRELDEVVRLLALQWRSIGAAEGAAMGALALVPVAGWAGAITLDVVVTHLLTSAIAMRVCYAYGYDAKDPELQEIVQRMVTKSFAQQAPKASTMRSAGLAAAAARDRTRWSKALREHHRLLAANEKLLQQLHGVAHVPVRQAAKLLPAISIIAASGTNAFVLGDVAVKAKRYAQTLFLAEKHDFRLPANVASLAS
ncbi:EcsC family protein [Promicromonospora sukumoe]|uniref:EcsC family protein n=1 Tax=Promicromonospora sukumoe TaxID=88382 RepID=UPI0037C6420B